jgi:hypothetical protein
MFALRSKRRESSDGQSCCRGSGRTYIACTVRWHDRDLGSMPCLILELRPMGLRTSCSRAIGGHHAADRCCLDSNMICSLTNAQNPGRPRATGDRAVRRYQRLARAHTRTALNRDPWSRASRRLSGKPVHAIPALGLEAGQRSDDVRECCDLVGRRSRDGRRARVHARAAIAPIAISMRRQITTCCDGAGPNDRQEQCAGTWRG